MNFIELPVIELPVDNVLKKVCLSVEHIRAIRPSRSDPLQTTIYTDNNNFYIIPLHYTTVINILKEKFNVYVHGYAYPDMPE